jgi:hypothetical protein
MPSTVVVGMDRPLGAIPPRESEDLSPKKIELIRSRNFLREVVNQLSACVQVRGYRRADMFDSISLGANVEYGSQ